MQFHLPWTVTALLVVYGVGLQAAPIVIADGPSAFSFSIGPTAVGDQVIVASWIADRSFADVSIRADLFNNGFDPANFIVYLTTEVGVFATSATQVAVATHTLDPGETYLELFHLPLLTPATYYLVLFGTTDTADLGWLVSNSATITAGPGVMEGARLYSNVGFNDLTGTNVSYPPGSKFANFDSPDDRVLLNVTGTGVPEPAMALPAGLALAALAWRRARASQYDERPGRRLS